MESVLNNYASFCHDANIKWWIDPATGMKIERNKGELLMLIVPRYLNVWRAREKI